MTLHHCMRHHFFNPISFVVCIVFAFFTPESLHARALLEQLLPGFKWLTFPGFLIGVVESFLYGAYAGLVYVPVYWNPPTLFDLAQRTGFDIESLIFTFAIGGIGAVSYRARAVHAATPVVEGERRQGRHRWHFAALAVPFPVFLLLLAFPWNPIYPGIAALFAGAFAAALCRPDLVRNSLWGGVVFLGLYLVFLLGLRWSWPGYIEAVWNLPQLLPWRPLGLPLEELLFGFGFGLYWSCVYEHVAGTHARNTAHTGGRATDGTSPLHSETT